MEIFFLFLIFVDKYVVCMCMYTRIHVHTLVCTYFQGYWLDFCPLYFSSLSSVIVCMYTYVDIHIFSKALSGFNVCDIYIYIIYTHRVNLEVDFWI